MPPVNAAKVAKGEEMDGVISKVRLEHSLNYMKSRCVEETRLQVSYWGIFAYSQAIEAIDAVQNQLEDLSDQASQEILKVTNASTVTSDEMWSNDLKPKMLHGSLHFTILFFVGLFSDIRSNRSSTLYGSRTTKNAPKSSHKFPTFGPQFFSTTPRYASKFIFVEYSCLGWLHCFSIRVWADNTALALPIHLPLAP